jgi:hypothetical protein
MVNLFIGESGVIFDFTLKDDGVEIDVTGVTTAEVILKPTTGSAITRPLTIVDAPTGKVRYVLGAGDIPTAGTWSVQVHLILPSGEFYSAIEKIAAWAHL